MYIVAHNILISVHYLDERTKHWLKDQVKDPENKPNTHHGLLLRVILTANLVLVGLFVCLEMTRRLLAGNSSQVSSILQAWNILRGVTANVATMVNYVMCCHVLS